MLRRILFATAGAVALSGAALAADLPTRAPPPVYLPPPPVYLWSGFYAGLNAGGTWSNNNSFTVATAPGFINLGAISPLGFAHAIAAANGMNGVLGTSNAGFIGGGQIGYNLQFGINWLAGLEADIQGVAGGSGGSSLTVQTVGPGFPANPVVTTISASRRIEYLGTVRGRLGFLWTPTFLIYGTGGLAYGGTTATASIFGAEVPPAGPNNGFWASTGTVSGTRIGWTAGGGIEWMFLPNWSVKVEYLYYDIGRPTFSAGVPFQVFPPATPFWAHFPAASTRFNGNIVRAGINYHFNWGYPAPIVAKY
ncbi:MAG: outer membrane beta-barrel protein [Beijerinckiaceae bacterium]|nr:outer membrane beta-barrel protein [Beijerinckiaceae bacterium]